MRFTSQRAVVLEYLRSVKSHPTAAEIFETVRKRLPGISLATVYRTLAWLRDKGEILELTYGDQASHYDGNTADHAHFTCSECGNVADIDLPLPDVDPRLVRRRLGAELRGRRVELIGICRKCLENKEEKYEHD